MKENKKKFVKNRDKEYGVARGVDFKGVQTVVNFDFPKKVKSYIHRVGRTARGGAKGSSLSLVTLTDETVMKKVEEKRIESGNIIQPYKFNVSIIEGLRYRVEDILRGVTKASIKDARLKEIKSEIINSEKLKNHFEENPVDLNLLKHDKTLQESYIQPHLKHIPRYLVPQAVQQAVMSTKSPIPNIHKKRGGKQNDPLRSFSISKSRKNDFGLDDIDNKNNDSFEKKRKGSHYGHKKSKKRKFK